MGGHGRPWAPSVIRGRSRASTIQMSMGFRDRGRASRPARGRLWACPWAPADAHPLVYPWACCWAPMSACRRPQAPTGMLIVARESRRARTLTHTDAHGHQRLPMGAHGRTRMLTDAHGCPWAPAQAPMDRPRMPTVAQRRLSASADAHGRAWMPTGARDIAHGCPRAPTDAHGTHGPPTDTH